MSSSLLRELERANLLTSGFLMHAQTTDYRGYVGLSVHLQSSGEVLDVAVHRNACGELAKSGDHLDSEGPVWGPRIANYAVKAISGDYSYEPTLMQAALTPLRSELISRPAERLLLRATALGAVKLSRLLPAEQEYREVKAYEPVLSQARPLRMPGFLPKLHTPAPADLTFVFRLAATHWGYRFSMATRAQWTSFLSWRLPAFHLETELECGDFEFVDELDASLCPHGTIWHYWPGGTGQFHLQPEEDVRAFPLDQVEEAVGATSDVLTASVVSEAIRAQACRALTYLSQQEFNRADPSRVAMLDLQTKLNCRFARMS